MRRNKTKRGNIRKKIKKKNIYICCKVKNWSKIWGFIS